MMLERGLSNTSPPTPLLDCLTEQGEDLSPDREGYKPLNQSTENGISARRRELPISFNRSPKTPKGSSETGRGLELDERMAEEQRMIEIKG